MYQFQNHIINSQASVRDSLKQLEHLAANAILFIVDNNQKLLGSLTDGDLRRGFIRGLGFDNSLLEFIQPDPKFIRKGNYSLSEIIAYRTKNYTVLPVLDEENHVVNVINFRYQKSYLPIDAVIMAGGRGERLKPLTDTIPKPLLVVGDKPIIEHNIDRLKDFGVDDIWISLGYLGEQIEDYFKNGFPKSLCIQYIHEKEALGTVGALSLVEGLSHDTVLVMNSDLLTNINFEDFYLFFEQHEADMAVACISYQVNVPYAVMETRDNWVSGFIEKPTFSHYSNAGIYLMKKEIINKVPKNTSFNTTDLIELLIQEGKRVAAYPLVDYWLDIGKPEDYKKAQEDIKQIKF